MRKIPESISTMVHHEIFGKTIFTHMQYSCTILWGFVFSFSHEKSTPAAENLMPAVLHVSKCNSTLGSSNGVLIDQCFHAAKLPFHSFHKFSRSFFHFHGLLLFSRPNRFFEARWSIWPSASLYGIKCTPRPSSSVPATAFTCSCRSFLRFQCW